MTYFPGSARDSFFFKSQVVTITQLELIRSVRITQHFRCLRLANVAENCCFGTVPKGCRCPQQNAVAPLKVMGLSLTTAKSF